LSDVKFKNESATDSMEQGGNGKFTNTILTSLPESEIKSLRPYLEFQELPLHTVLVDPAEPLRYAYFLDTGAASFVVPTSEGRSVEVGLVGKSGLVGMPLAFGVKKSNLRITMQFAGTGHRIRAEDLQGVLPSTPHLQNMMCRFTLLQGMQASQTAACNRLHNLEQRLARWLLMTQDRVGSEFVITQEYLAELLGTGRPSISLAASQMQKAGAIRYSRGMMKVANRGLLERMSCECYATLRRFYRDLGLVH
jgi:CRP-like cAMP-binding protein